jgi:hypothetical protein
VPDKADQSALSEAYWKDLQAKNDIINKHMQEAKPKSTPSPQPSSILGAVTSLFGRKPSPFDAPIEDDSTPSGPTLNPELGPPQLPGAPPPATQGDAPPPSSSFNPYTMSSGNRKKGGGRYVDSTGGSALAGAPPRTRAPAQRGARTAAAVFNPATFAPAAPAPTPEPEESSTSDNSLRLLSLFETEDSFNESITFADDDEDVSDDNDE